jgi:hypothetical protein
MVLVFDSNGEIRHPTVAESVRGAIIVGVLAVGVALGGVAAIRRARRARRPNRPVGEG